MWTCLKSTRDCSDVLLNFHENKDDITCAQIVYFLLRNVSLSLQYDRNFLVYHAAWPDLSLFENSPPSTEYYESCTGVSVVVSVHRVSFTKQV